MINSPNPLAHDIGLRRELERSITQQENINSHITRLDSDIKELQKAVEQFSPYISTEQINSILDQKIKDIRAEIWSIMDLAKKQHTENISAFIATSDKTLANAAGSADSASRTLDIFVFFVGFVMTFLAAVGGVIAFIVYKAGKTVAEVKAVTSDIQNERSKLELLKQEMMLMHKFVDLKDAYRLYVTMHRKRDVDHLKSYLYKKINYLETGYRDLRDLWNKQSFIAEKEVFLSEVRDNLSFCYAVKGVLEYNNGEKLEAAKWFEQAYLNNESGFTDRIRNFGSASAIRYAKTQEQCDLDKIVKCYVELAHYTGERERFVADDDISECKGLKIKIDEELRNRGQEALIVPDPLPKE